MLLDRHIVITGIQSWDITIGSNIKNMASEWAKNNKVLFVNPPADRISILMRKNAPVKTKTWYVQGIGNISIYEAQKNLWVLQPLCTMESINKIWIPSWFNWLNKRNNALLGYEIIKAIKFLELSNYIHICDSDMFRSQHLKEILKPVLSVYYSRDNLLAVNYWKRHGVKAEPAIMKKADLVLTNSEYLEKLARKHNTNSYFVGQGCDTSSYQANKKYKLPKEIKPLSSPVIGYIGSLNTLRLDIDILEYIASSCPEWNIVLVGPEDDGFKKSRLHQYDNVHFTGSKPEAELPKYLSAFDVAINPQLVNKVTIGNYPRKIDEYLAMGKPVVATKTEAMAFFSQHVSLASNHKEWVELIKKELINTSELATNNRIEFASLHTWDNNIKEIGKRIIDREKELASELLIHDEIS